ncbi:MAG: heavy metal-binding domain-containing protein, partial [Myxococcota bacterium]|nr:heavy metal-binding domain-containing protein [Myxococcota bacterium]
MTDDLHDEEVSPEQPTDPTEDVEETSEETEVSSEERASSDAAPRASNLKQRIALAVMLVFAVGLGFLIGRNSEPDAGDASEHTHAHGEGGDASAEETWTCSMHPQIRAKEPGSCPICGMDLIPATSNDTGPPLTSSQVRLSERARTLAKIQTEAVTTTSQDRSTRQLFGQVVENEGAKRSITSWISGRVDRLLVSTTGARVKRGQTLAKMYSPEVYAAHQDLLVAQQQLERLSG